MDKRDVSDSAGVTSKLSDMQNAIESLTHSVNTVATKQQVRMLILRFSFKSGQLSASTLQFE